MEKKPGTALTAVAPAAVTDALDADSADPGEVAEVKAEQRKKQSGKYGSKQVPAYKPPEDKEKKTTWIEIELVDRDGNPIPSEPYRIEDPEGRIVDGTLDEKGFAHRDWIVPGTCKISFPRLDQDAWAKA